MERHISLSHCFCVLIWPSGTGSGSKATWNIGLLLPVYQDVTVFDCKSLKQHSRIYAAAETKHTVYRNGF